MVKSGSPVFVLLFAFLFKLEKPSFQLAGIIGLICLGVFIMVANDTKFEMYGYILVQTATILSGLRWALTQVLLKKQSLGINNPLATIRTIAPLIMITLFFCFEVMEGGFASIVNSPFFSNGSKSLDLILVIISGGVLAFIMVLVEFSLISHTSVVTLSVAGIFKEIVTLLTSHWIFSDKMTINMLIGLVISLIGIGLYNYTKFVVKDHVEFHELAETDIDELFNVDLEDEWDEEV